MPIPLLVKHMTVAVFDKEHLSDDRIEKFRQAFAIARSRCAKYGLIGADGIEGAVENIALTAKGSAKESAHRREQGAKSELFDSLLELLQGRELAEKAKDAAGAPPGASGPPGTSKAPRTPKQAILDKLRDGADKIK